MTHLQLIPLVAFYIGASIGSFLNVIILRYINHTSPLKGRSQCPKCKKTLRWPELIPIFSFIFLRGQCRQCKNQISVQYPLVEFTMGCILLILTLSAPIGGIALLTGIGALLLVLFVIDLKTFLLPDRYVGLLSLFVLGYLFLQVTQGVGAVTRSLTDIVGGAGIGGGFLLILWVLTKGKGIGLGDVKLMIPVGALFGISGTITILFLSFVAGGLVSIYLLARQRAQLGTAIPFGPFLCSAALLTLLVPSTPMIFINTILGL